MTKVIVLSPLWLEMHPGAPLEHLDANLGHAPIRNPQAARGGERQVENAVANLWSAVGDHNYD